MRFLLVFSRSHHIPVREGVRYHAMTSDPPDSIPAQKENLRKRFIRFRQSLTDDEYEQLSAAIVEHAATHAVVGHAKTVHVYWPLVADREIDTRPLIARLESRGAEIILPVVLNFDREEEPALKHVRFPGAEHLRVNKWGIAEPKHGESVDVRKLDAVIVPALGVGRNGHRIGRGRGYYDAFLSTVNAPKICLVYNACFVEVVPREAHDVAIEVVMTEHGVVRI